MIFIVRKYGQKRVNLKPITAVDQCAGEETISKEELAKRLNRKFLSEQIDTPYGAPLLTTYK